MKLDELENICLEIDDNIHKAKTFLEDEAINKEWIGSTLEKIQTLADNVYEIYQETCGLEEEHEELKKDNEYLEEQNEILKTLVAELAQNNLQLQLDLKFKYNIDY